MVFVEGVFTDAPLSFRYRCILSAHWPAGFQPYTETEFQPISTEQRAAVVA